MKTKDDRRRMLSILIRAGSLQGIQDVNYDINNDMVNNNNLNDNINQDFNNQDINNNIDNDNNNEQEEEENEIKELQITDDEINNANEENENYYEEDNNEMGVGVLPENINIPLVNRMHNNIPSEEAIRNEFINNELQKMPKSDYDEQP